MIKYLTLVLISISLNLFSQETDVWIGEELTEIFLKNGVWLYQSEDQLIQIKTLKGERYFTDHEGNMTHKIRCSELTNKLDSIILYRNNEKKIFYSPSQKHTYEFDFHAFELDIISSFGTLISKYHLNKYGVYRKSNFKNETETEKHIDDKDLKYFIELISLIDIKSIQNKEDWRSQCLDDDYRFTFWDKNGTEYSYIAMRPRKQFEEIIKFVQKLKE